MTSQIQFTALYGTGPHEPFCFLLEIDYCRILLDCGWDYCFSDKDVETLKRIGHIDAVLISHCSIQHLGALPYAVSKLGLSCPIYSTLPTWKMGQMFMYDAFQNVKERNSEFTHFTIDDVDATFDRFIKLKYSQDVKLPDRGDEITITPFSAGHLLGGTVWRISKETEEIVYAVDFNHKRERHLDGATLEALRRPAVLIGDCLNVRNTHPLRTKRDEQLLTDLITCLRNNGSVLMPTDTAGRCLELLQILHTHWTTNKLAGTYSLVFLSNTSKPTIDFANSMIEWMSDKTQKFFDETGSHPFAFENLRICSNRSDLDSLPKPQVVLATNPYMEGDFAQELFIEWSSNPRNLVVFTQRAPKHTLAGKLMENPNAETVKFVTTSIVPLEGEELAEYIQLKREAQLEKDALDDRSDSDSDAGEAIVIEDDDIADPKQPSKQFSIRPVFPMFLASERHLEFDDYGEVIDYSKFFPNEDDNEEIVPFQKDKKSEELKMDIDEEMGEIPVKTISRTLLLNFRCKIQYIDFEGLSDGRSLKTIISNIAPRKMILIHGDKESCEELKEFCEESVCKTVSIAEHDKCLDITSDSSAFKVILKDDFAQTLKFQLVNEDYEVAYMDGIATGDSSYSGVQVIEQAPSGRFKGHPTIFLGDVKLLDVKNALYQKGINAEFVQGILVCGKSGIVNIQKISPTHLKMSGALCDDYYKIRDLLYGKFQII
uniref:Cleavage and polyadenylation specificity factor subunit 2 n=2 Tax=Hirondellea gigas TaxID=1518452 RepID=A0A6A7G3W9_9CRUS